jgi:hypothetical protein
MMKLAKNVGGLLSGLSLSSAGTATPLTLLSCTATNLESLPVCRDRTFCRIADTKFLTPCRLVHAQIMFCGHTEIANKYLSFGDANDEVVARGQWLLEELEAVALCCGRRQAEFE